MKLTNKDFRKIKRVNNVREVTLSCGDFYVKDTWNIKHAVNEVIGRRLASIFNLKCPYYKVVIFDYDGNTALNSQYHKYYSLSQDLFNEHGKFETAREIGILFEENYSLYQIWFKLERLYGTGKVADLMTDIVKVYIFDLLFGGSDRHASNWGIYFTNTTRKVTIIDNEFLFDNLEGMISSYFSREIYNAVDKVSSYEDFKRKEFTNFLNDSSEEFINLFLVYYNLFTPEYLEELLLSIEGEEKFITEFGEVPFVISHKDEIMENYINNYELLGSVLEERKLK